MALSESTALEPWWKVLFLIEAYLVLSDGWIEVYG